MVVVVAVVVAWLCGYDLLCESVLQGKLCNRIEGSLWEKERHIILNHRIHVIIEITPLILILVFSLEILAGSLQTIHYFEHDIDDILNQK